MSMYEVITPDEALGLALADHAEAKKTICVEIDPDLPKTIELAKSKIGQYPNVNILLYGFPTLEEIIVFDQEFSDIFDQPNVNYISIFLLLSNLGADPDKIFRITPNYEGSRRLFYADPFLVKLADPLWPQETPAATQ